MPERQVSRDIARALNDRFRGHTVRDWAEWRENNAYDDVQAIPAGSTKAWISRQKSNFQGIGKLQSLNHLICGNADQAMLNEIGQLSQLERLELEWPVVAKDISPLLRLSKLKFLSIDSPRHIADFAPLLELAALRTLIITNAKKMTDIEWLADAHHLEVIGIEGGMWSAYPIPSLRPLARLPSLRAFLGTSTRLGDKDLSPLATCPKLDFLAIAAVAPREEFELLQAAKPGLQCDWFNPELWAAISPKRR